jgi:BirA family biotin operon repressor/biotin-[acetyl-CoA-carboxylase] ligase
MSFSIGATTAKWSQEAGLKTWFEKETGSTNAIAKSVPLQLEPCIEVYLTDHQTSGRGRGSHIWSEGQPGGALLSSWVFPRSSAPAPILSPLIGLAVFRAFHQTWPFLDWNLKAPNDLYIGEKKIAGLLIENISGDENFRLIVGLGLNVFSQPSLETATHLNQELKAHHPRLTLTEEEWKQALDRLLLELTLVANHSHSYLNETERAALLWALNRHPLLSERYLALSAEGSLHTISKTHHWSDL